MTCRWRPVLLLLLALALAGCAPSTTSPAPKPAAAPTAPGAAPPTAAQAANPPAAAVDGAAVSGTVQANAGEWERLKEAATREGRVVVAGPGFPALRNGVTEGFQRAHGIQVEYVGLPGGELMARLDREARAGKPTVDVNIAGNNSVWIIGERGQLDNVVPLLVDPDVVRSSVWRDGAVRLVPPSPSMPKDFYGGLQTAEWVMTDLFVDSDVVPPGAITSWQDLLKPEYKGKIASQDPRQPGPAWSTVGYLDRLFGIDYLRELYKGQEVVLTADTRQLAEWVARGTYPIGIALYQASIEPMKAAGLPLERVYPSDGPGILTGGFGSVMKIKDGPNPSAAAVFLNWWASRDAQEMYEGAVQEMSLRTDVSHKVPDYIVPRAGVEYRYNAYDPDQHYNSTLPTTSALQEIIGR